MANRVTVPTTNFELLSPPWSLASLDNDFITIQSALNDASLGYVTTGTDSGTANHYNIATPSFGMPSSYQVGMTVLLIPANSNSSGSCTLAVGGLSVQPIQMGGGGALVPFGWIGVGKPILLIYIGTAFQIVATGAAPVGSYTVGVGSTLTVDCIYASSVTVFASWNAITTTALTLNRLPSSIPVQVTFQNTLGGTSTFTIAAFDILGNAMNVYATFPSSTAGAVVTNLSTGHTIPVGNTLTMNGSWVGADLYFTG